MPKKTFPIEELKQLLEEGLSIQELAGKFGTSHPTMSKFLKENNLKTKRQMQLEKCNQLDTNLIVKMYEEGKTILGIANELNVSNSAIKARLKESNVHIRTNSEAHKKYNEDYEYFNNIDTYDKAYLLGFICADGYVTDRNVLGIGLAIKDKDMVYWFQKQMKTDKPVQEKLDEKYPSALLEIQNEKLTKVLNNYGIIPNKTLVLDIGSVIQKANISKELIPAFLLGYFDGDGGVYKTLGASFTTQYSCSVTGTLETCEYFKKYFNDIGFITKRHDDNKNNYTYQIGGRNKVKEGLSKLYSIKDNLSFFYNRKYQIYCEL